MGFYPIQEAYFGKTPGIMKCYNAFSKFRSKYVGLMSYRPTINTDDDLINFNRAMEEEFGFSLFELYVINSTQMNAYTRYITATHFENPKAALRRTKTGIKYAPEAKLTCIVSIYTGLLLRPEFTDAEVFAIILHEVGHNFQEALSDSITALTVGGTVMNYLLAILNMLFGSYDTLVVLLKDQFFGQLVKTINILGAKLSRDKGAIGAVVGWCSTFKNAISDTVSTLGQAAAGLIPFTGLLAALQQLPSLAINRLINPSMAAARITGEYSADSFPVMYGFGAEMASGLQKMGNARGTLGFADKAIENSFLNSYYQFNLLPLYVVTGIFDEHPTTLARVKNIVEKSVHELKSQEIDPKLKKQLLAEAKQCQDTFNDIYDKAQHMDKSQKQVFYNAFNVWIHDMTGSDAKQWAKDMFDLHADADRNISNAPLYDSKKLPINMITLK